MKKITARAAVIAFCLSVSLHAQAGLMLDSGDTALEWAYLDRISCGKNLPTTIHSISVREASFYGLDTGISSPEEPSVSGKISLQPFFLGWNGLDVSRNMTDSSMLNRLRLDDPALLLGVSFGSGSFYGKTQIDFGTDMSARYAEKNGSIGFWKPLEYFSFWTFPEEGYLAWSDKNITLAAGRLKTGIGLGKTNIFLNGQARWYDQAQFSWWSERFRLFSFWGSSATHLDLEEYAIQSYFHPTVDNTEWGWDSINNHDASTQSLVPLKLFTYHRVEFKPAGAVGFGLSEMQLVGGKSPDLTNLLPTVMWHNTYSAGVSNVMLHADAWAVPVRGLLVYGEFVMDDSKAPKETGSSKPNCWAWSFGTAWVLPVESPAWRFSLAAEFSHADKWTYNRWQPYLTMYQRQMITGGHRGFDIPLAHSEGGDVDRAQLTLTALERGGKRLELGYTYTNKGPVYLGMSAANNNYDPDTAGLTVIPVYYDFDDYAGEGSLAAFLGTVRKHTHTVNAKAVWPMGAHWEANAEIDWRIILNAGHEAGKTATETVYKTGVKWTYGK